MNALILRNRHQGNATLVENEFIDQYMAAANGEYVKVYLLLLRHLNNPCASLSIPQMADLLEDTEGDIVRALHYWEKAELLTLELDEAQNIIGVEMGRTPRKKTVPVAPLEPEEARTPEPDVHIRRAGQPETLAPAPKQSPQDRKALQQLLFVAEQYMGRTLSSGDIDTITYFYDSLSFSADLIEYLLEYCVENGHKSMAYIRKVALSWSDEHITTVEQARANSALYSKTCYSILNAFGIKGRGPAASELKYIRKWTELWQFDLELVLEAVDRTVKAIHQPGFEYTDRILESWREKGVHTLEEVRLLDAAFEQEKQPPKRAKGRRAPQNAGRAARFEEHSYDMDALTRSLIQNH